MILTKINNTIEAITGFRIIKVRPREFIPAIKKHFGDKELVGAEIGVLGGVTSKQILRNLKIKKLYLIDPYKPYYSYPTARLARHKKQAKKNTEGYPVQFVSKISSEACKEIKEKLDFVYIDGNHEYEFVKQDIENYWPLLKPGGILSGDDFWNAIYPGNTKNGVIQAVTEFCVARDLELFVRNVRWWIIKPDDKPNA